MKVMSALLKSAFNTRLKMFTRI